MSETKTVTPQAGPSHDTQRKIPAELVMAMAMRIEQGISTFPAPGYVKESGQNFIDSLKKWVTEIQAEEGRK